MPLDLAASGIELALGAFIGLCMGLTGVGGGVLLLPALTAVLGLAPSLAVGTASTYAALTRVQASWEHHRLGTVDARAGATLLLGALPGTFFAARYVKAHAVDPGFQQALGALITCAIVVSGGLMVLRILRDRGGGPGGAADRAGEEPEPPASVHNAPVSPALLCLRLLAGLGTGVLIASTSVGGGVILIPILMFLFGLPIARTVGTSNFVGLALASLAAGVYLLGAGPGQVAIGTALTMWVGSLAGVRAGSRLSVRLPPAALQLVVVGMIFLSAIVMAWGCNGTSARPAEGGNREPAVLARASRSGPAAAKLPDQSHTAGPAPAATVEIPATTTRRL